MSAHREHRPRWHRRWAKNAAIALAPACALAALLYVGAQTRELVPALWAYGAGALAGAVVGTLLGGLTGAVRLRVRLQRRARSARPTGTPTWVMHRPRSGAAAARLVHR